jgi:hypothetical protein
MQTLVHHPLGRTVAPSGSLSVKGRTDLGARPGKVVLCPPSARFLQADKGVNDKKE